MEYGCVSCGLCVLTQQKRCRGRTAGPLSAVYAHFPELESSAHEKAWLLRVAINLSKNKLNSAWFKHTNALEESYPCDDLDSDLAFVWDAVRALPPKYANPFICSIMKGILPRKLHAFSVKQKTRCVLCCTEDAVCSKRH